MHRVTKESGVQTQPHLLEDNSNAPSIVAWLRKEIIMLEVNVSFADCVVEGHVVTAEDGREGEVEFCFCEAGGCVSWYVIWGFDWEFGGERAGEFRGRIA